MGDRPGERKKFSRVLLPQKGPDIMIPGGWGKRTLHRVSFMPTYTGGKAREGNRVD